MPIGIATFKIGLDGVIVESRLALLLSAIVLIGMKYESGLPILRESPKTT